MDVLTAKWKAAKNSLKRNQGKKEFKRNNNGDDEQSTIVESDCLDSPEKLEIELVKDIDRNEKVYHEMDFTLKNPIIFCNNGDIIVRSKFAQKPPVCPEFKANRAKKSRSYGFDGVRHLLDRPVNSERIKASHHDVRLNTPPKSAQSTPKFEKKIKAFKLESFQFFGHKPSSANYPLAGEDHMFLDFSKKVMSVV